MGPRSVDEPAEPGLACPPSFEAFRDALDAGRLDLANALVVSAWPRLLDAHAADARALLAPLPSDRLVQYPLLGLVLGFCCRIDPVERPNAARYLALAARGTRARLARATIAERIAIHCAESAALRELGQSKGAISAARAAVRLLATADDEQLAQVADVPRLYADLGWTFFEDGRSEEALVAFLRGLAGGDARDDTGGNLATICAMQALEGDVLAAGDNLAVARQRPGSGPRTRLYVGLAEALLALERSDPVAAAAHVEAIGTAGDAAEGWIELARMEAAVALVSGRAAVGLAGSTAPYGAARPRGGSPTRSVAWPPCARCCSSRSATSTPPARFCRAWAG